MKNKIYLLGIIPIWGMFIFVAMQYIKAFKDLELRKWIYKIFLKMFLFSIPILVVEFGLLFIFTRVIFQGQISNEVESIIAIINMIIYAYALTLIVFIDHYKFQKKLEENRKLVEQINKT